MVLSLTDQSLLEYHVIRREQYVIVLVHAVRTELRITSTLDESLLVLLIISYGYRGIIHT